MVTYSKELRLKVFKKFNGRCAYCGCKISGRFHIDHISPILRKTDQYNPSLNKIDNLYPSCVTCNCSKGTLSIEEFRRKLKSKLTTIEKESATFSLLKKYGLIKVVQKDVVFYFEKG